MLQAGGKVTWLLIHSCITRWPTAARLSLTLSFFLHKKKFSHLCSLSQGKMGIKKSPACKLERAQPVPCPPCLAELDQAGLFSL